MRRKFGDASPKIWRGKMKIYISVDIEGISGLRGGREHDDARKHDEERDTDDVIIAFKLFRVMLGVAWSVR